MAKTPETIDSLDQISSRYKAIICDVWGVLHNGITHSPDAAAALAKARDGGMPVVLITNAPRPCDSVIAQIEAIGVLASGGIESAALLWEALRCTERVYPIYVRKGFQWEDTDLDGIPDDYEERLANDCWILNFTCTELQVSPPEVGVRDLIIIEGLLA